MEDKIKKALDIADRYGDIDGGHHKMWVIDQMVRCLAGAGYNEWARRHCNRADGNNSWDMGIPP